MIEVQNLTRIFRTYKKQPGFWGGVKGLFNRTYDETAAAKDITFSIMAMGTQAQIPAQIEPSFV